MKPLKEFYEENGIQQPKTLLEREVWLYDKMVEDTALMVQGVEAQTNELTIAEEKIVKLKADLRKDNIAAWAGGSMIAGSIIACALYLIFTGHNDELNTLKQENNQLKDTAAWVKDAKRLEAENQTLKTQLDEKRDGVFKERVLLIAGSATGACVLTLLFFLLVDYKNTH